eukprot:scaffold122262_cov28-Tisochrysis_lutea.AAC.1
MYGFSPRQLSQMIGKLSPSVRLSSPSARTAMAAAPPGTHSANQKTKGLSVTNSETPPHPL